jgi:hypothetical protein
MRRRRMLAEAVVSVVEAVAKSAADMSATDMSTAESTASADMSGGQGVRPHGYADVMVARRIMVLRAMGFCLMC